MNRNLWRAATVVQQRLHAQRDQPDALDFPEAWAVQIAALVRRFRRAEQRGWRLAARRLRDRLLQAVAIHQLQVDDLHTKLRQPAPVVPSLGAIYGDLVALAEEFEDVRYEHGHRQLVARTEPIELEGLFLGPFDVVLHLDRLGQHAPYDVVAVDPRPAAANSSVAHPHVESGTLCEGDGRGPIASALAAGRLHDFFVIVDRILHTYNSASPYVGLDAWHGLPCGDCGRTVTEDDRIGCTRCETDLCDDCASSCEACADSLCSYCLTPCSACDAPTCSTCLRTCRGCGETFCEEHIQDDLCTACHKDREAAEEEEAAASRAAILAARLGQAGVLA